MKALDKIAPFALAAEREVMREFGAPVVFCPCPDNDKEADQSEPHRMQNLRK